VCQLRVVIEVAADRSMLASLGCAKLYHLPRLEQYLDCGMDVNAICFCAGLIVCRSCAFLHFDPVFLNSDLLWQGEGDRKQDQ
jgi:hypothetical protein